MKLTIISGLSGSGKSVALNTLEDEGYYCTDNIPISLLPELYERICSAYSEHYDNVAVGIDARSKHSGLQDFPKILKELRDNNVHVEILFLSTSTSTLLQRFSETRRKHPLSHTDRPLAKAIEYEKIVLADIRAVADLVIDTTNLNLHQLRQQIREQMLKRELGSTILMFQSFGFKHGHPKDSDFIFDVRCLPNPYWDPQLRNYNGDEEPIIEYLDNEHEVSMMFDDIRTFLESWLPRFEHQSRAYVTVSIGCTGGRHRSVYLANKLRQYFHSQHANTGVRHRDLQ